MARGRAVRRPHAGGRVWCLAVIVVAALALGAGEASAQSGNWPRVWLGLGLGGGAAQDLDADGGVSIQLTGQWGPHQVTFRSLHMGDIGSFPDGSSDAISEVGLLYGRRAAWSFGYVAGAAGVAMVGGEGFPGASGERRETVGVPVVAEVGLQSKLVGLGIQVFGNLNSVSMFGGVSVFLDIGWMP